MEGYINKTDVIKMTSFIGSKLIDVSPYVIDYGTIKGVEYFELTLSEKGNIYIANGNLSENVEICFNFDLNAKRTKLKEIYADEVPNLYKDKEIRLDWIEFFSRNITNIELMDYKGYCHNSIIISFEGDLLVEIFGGIEGLGFEFNKEKIRRLYSDF